MKRKFIIARDLFRSIKSLWHKDLVMVSDESQWAVDWEAFYISKYLTEIYGVKPSRMEFPWYLRNQIIHFINRYSYLYGPFEDLHPSNRVLLTWYHGDPSDPNPAMRELFDILPKAIPYLDKVITSCTKSRDTLIECGVSPSQVKIIPIGIDLSVFMPTDEVGKKTARSSLGIPLDAICIGSFQKDGQGWGEGMEPKAIKGPDVFLEAVQKIALKHNNVFVLLTGPTRGYMKAGLEKIQVPYVHHMVDDYRNMPHCYHALDFYIISSRDEGGPKALLECWATGIPVISTKVGMAIDIVQDENNGLLSDIGDSSSLADQSLRLIQDDSLRRTIVSQSVEDVRQFDYREVARKYHDEVYIPYLS